VVVEADCVLAWVNGAAGGSTSFGDLRPTPESLIHCKRIRAKGIKGCARAGERERARRGGAWLTVDGGFERTRSQIWRTPARNFAGLAASRAGGRKGDGEGVEGYL
jgi:hypothetical protein